MDYDRQWLIDMLQHLGRGQVADDAARETMRRERCPNASRARSSTTSPYGTASSPSTS